MEETFAIGNGAKVDLWCRRLPEDHFEVLNGGWKGKLRHGGIEVRGKFKPAAVIWRGEVPMPFAQDYNDAIHWIEDELAREQTK